MYDVVVLQYGECHGESYAVVGAQRRAASLEPAVVLVGVDGVGEGIGHSDAHHVHVVEQYDGFCLLVARCGGFADDDAVLLVAFVLQVEPLGELAQVVGYFLLVVGGSWYLVQLTEDAEHAFGGGCCHK